MITILNRRGNEFECADDSKNITWVPREELEDFILKNIKEPLKEGDKVKIKRESLGRIYSTYTEWILNNLPYKQGVYFRYGYSLSTADTEPVYKILKIAPHGYSTEVLAAITTPIDTFSPVYLIDLEALQKYENS